MKLTMSNDARFTVIIILLLVNLGLMSYLWLRHDGRRPHQPTRHMEESREGGRNGEGMNRFLDHELGLNPAQADAFDSLRSDFFRQSNRLRREMNAERKHLYDLVATSEATDGAAIEQQAQAIAAKQKALDLLTFNHFTTLRKQLTEAQQPKFDTIMHHMLLMAPDQRPHRPFNRDRREHNQGPDSRNDSSDHHDRGPRSDRDNKSEGDRGHHKPRGNDNQTGMRGGEGRRHPNQDDDQSRR